MNSTKMIGWGGFFVIACLLLVAGGCSQLKARDELNKGVAAYKAAQYQVAIEHFKRAVGLDPTLVNARLYLATAYATQYVPGVDTEENLQIGEQAVVEFQNVLAENPANLDSITGIAQLYFNMKRMDEAKEFRRKQIGLDPTNPEAYYAVGVIDWTLTYQPRMELKARLGLRPDAPFQREQDREALAERNVPLIEEGMENLNKAIEIRPDYDDAMAYLNLLFREKADVADTPEEREELLKTADMWIERTLAIKKARAEEAAEEAGG